MQDAFLVSISSSPFRNPAEISQGFRMRHSSRKEQILVKYLHNGTLGFITGLSGQISSKCYILTDTVA